MNLPSRADFGKLLAEKNMLGHAAEIGVCRGQYAKDILSWGMKKLYLVDLWAHVPGMKAELGAWTDQEHEHAFQDCMERLNGDEDRFVVLRGWSEEMAKKVPDESLSFVHIDATHYYEWVMKDLVAWFPKLKPGGIMSGHDYLNTGLSVRQAADEFAESVGAEMHTTDIDRPTHACFWFWKGDDSK